MKFSTLVFSTLLASAPAFAHVGATDWMDLEKSEIYLLSQDLTLTGLRGEKIEIETASEYRLAEITPLDGLSVVEYVFAAEKCEEPAQESEMELILPNDSEPGANAEVGVQLVPECRLEIFVETKDLGRPSLYRIP